MLAHCTLFVFAAQRFRPNVFFDFSSWSDSLDHYLSDRPQHASWMAVCTCDCLPGTVLSLFLLTLYTADFNWNSDLLSLEVLRQIGQCQMHIWRGRAGVQGYFRGFLDSGVWCEQNHLLLNTSKTKEILIEFHQKFCEWAKWHTPQKKGKVVGVDPEWMAEQI